MRYITKLYNWFFKPLISIFYFTIKHKTSDNRDWKCRDDIKQKTNKGNCWMSEIIHNEQCILIHYHFCLCPLCYVMVMAMYSIFYLQEKTDTLCFRGHTGKFGTISWVVSKPNFSHVRLHFLIYTCTSITHDIIKNWENDCIPGTYLNWQDTNINLKYMYNKRM